MGGSIQKTIIIYKRVNIWILKVRNVKDAFCSRHYLNCILNPGVKKMHYAFNTINGLYDQQDHAYCYKLLYNNAPNNPRK